MFLFPVIRTGEQWAVLTELWSTLFEASQTCVTGSTCPGQYVTGQTRKPFIPTSTVTLFEASSLDRIKMNKNWLEFDRKIFTTMNLIFWTCPKFMTPTNINFKKYASEVDLDRSHSNGSQARTGWDTCPALLALRSSKRKNSRHGG